MVQLDGYLICACTFGSRLMHDVILTYRDAVEDEEDEEGNAGRLQPQIRPLSSDD